MNRQSEYYIKSFLIEVYEQNSSIKSDFMFDFFVI